VNGNGWKNKEREKNHDERTSNNTVKKKNKYKWKRDGERIESETKCVDNLEVR
jgi:hypothetical protein